MRWLLLCVLLLGFDLLALYALDGLRGSDRVVVARLVEVLLPAPPTTQARMVAARAAEAWGVEFESRRYFKAPYFGRLIATHNRAVPRLKQWRMLMARHAPALAQFVKTFPGADHLSEAALREVLASPLGCLPPACSESVFDPWINRWSGTWSDQTTQFHVWDHTRYWQGQWVQPVTQSEVRYPDRQHLDAMLGQRAADLAINVYSDALGISGWVSKRQHEPVEIPCIGYLLDETTLLWVAQMHTPDRLFAPETTWFFFLEQSNAPVRASRYRIYGQPVEIDEGVRWVPKRSIHFGAYVASKSAMNMSPP